MGSLEEQYDRYRCVDGSLVRKSLPVFTAIDSPVLSEKWPLGICAALLRSLHCYGLVLAKGREENLTCNVVNQRHSTIPPTQGSRIGMSRNVSILSVVAATMMLTVLAVGSVAFAEQDDGGGQEKVALCHNGHIITVGFPA